MMTILNAGADIVETNYFESQHAKAGYCYVSINASTVRILLPDSFVCNLDEMLTGHICVISRGKLNGIDALEFMFDDNSDAPYALHLCMEQVDRGIPNDGKKFKVTAWTSKGKAGEWEGKYRVASKLPCLIPWSGSEMLASKNKMVEKQNSKYKQVIIDTFGTFPYGWVEIPYHSTLPSDISEWHCYLTDCGHSILSLPKCLADEAFTTGRPQDFLAPVSVKTVLRGYVIREGYVVVDVVYDLLLGIDCPDGDDEF